MSITSWFLFLSLSLFTLPFIPSSSSLHFNFTPITSEQNSTIDVSGSASITPHGIHVTPDKRTFKPTVGRATYHEPLHLWDNVSKSMADFSTHFSFVIDSNGNESYADGLAFFLAPVDSTVNEAYYGGGLGLWNSSANTSSSESHETFVAVEFDTFGSIGNIWDTIQYTHVGIDINSMYSVATGEWSPNVTGGTQNDAWITYNATLRKLTVTFNIDASQQESLSYSVDLRDRLPEYVIFGFSAATGDWFEKNNVNSWEFSSTVLPEAEAPAPSPTPVPIFTPTQSPSPHVATAGGNQNSRERKNKNHLVVGLTIGLSIFILALASVVYCLWKKYGTECGDEDFVDPSLDKEFGKDSGPKEFPYCVLSGATKKFAESEKLGEGGFGGVYRGKLRETNSDIAVKKVSRESQQGLKEYQSEVKIISQLKHRNLVQLLGWCHKRSRELLLVYEYMPNGSLDSHLFKGKSRLTWQLRYKIAKGLASALLYLHEEGVRCVVHRDIKASNILLDSNFDAKLGDFGLARLVDHEKGSQTTIVAGTPGYMAPEYAITGKATKESDVYSFGVVLLEIACGRRPKEYSLPIQEVTLVEWVWSLYGMGRLLDAADPKLGTSFDEQELENMLVVGLWCVHPDSTFRPSIRQAFQVLNMDVQVPMLPRVMPVATYDAPKRSPSGGISTRAYSGGHGGSEPVSYSSHTHSSSKRAYSGGSSTS